jgi:hypothetical protein
MGLRFLMLESHTGPHDNRTLLFLERTPPPALRTGLLFAQPVGLQLGRHLQGARQQRMHGRQRHIFHLGQINAQAGALLIFPQPFASCWMCFRSSAFNLRVAMLPPCNKIHQLAPTKCYHRRA